LLRIWLPLAGVALVLVVLGWMAWTSLTGHLGLANVLFTKDGVTMVDPHIAGRAQGRAYDMVAKRGVQSFDSAKRVRFEELTGRVEMQDRRWVRLQAPVGIFDGTAQTLRLEGGVDVVTSEGYRITTASADIDLERGDMKTADRVTVATGDQTLTAAAARVSDGGHVLVFDGGVRLDLAPKVRTVPPEADAATSEISRPDTARPDTARKETP
jgi:lipopolysaccharide export system protein LptC